MEHFEHVRAQSRYDAWAGKPFSRTSRFHHLVDTPELEPGFRVDSAARPRPPAPALGFASWEVHGSSPRASAAYVNAFEYPTLATAHEQFLQSLQSISRADVDFTALAGGPGDVYVEGTMLRDNVALVCTVADPKDAPQRLAVLRAIDAWLVSNWPLAAARRAGPLAPLDVVLRATPAALRVGEAADLTVDVRRGGSPVDVNRLPHQIVVSPGRIERKGAGYAFTPSATGNATISVSVHGAGGEHGAATLTIHVR